MHRETEAVVFLSLCSDDEIQLMLSLGCFAWYLQLRQLLEFDRVDITCYMSRPN